MRGHDIESERRAGLFVDYSQALRTTFAQLVERHIREECPKHKGCAVETYTLKGFLADSRDELAEAIAARAQALAAGQQAPSSRARRIPRRGLRWLHKPIAQVVPVDVESYIHDRLDQNISPATIDRGVTLPTLLTSTAHASDACQAEAALAMRGLYIRAGMGTFTDAGTGAAMALGGSRRSWPAR